MSSFVSRIMASSSAEQVREAIGGAVVSGNSGTGISITSNNAMQVGAVFSCILVLAQSVAQLPIHMYQENGDLKTKASDHPYYRLIHDQPNSWMTSYEMMQLIILHQMLRGNSIWFKSAVGGRVRELLPIHPDNVQEIKQDELYRLFYKIQRPGTGGSDWVPGDQLVHFRGMSLDGFQGLNPIQYAREMIGLAKATEQHGAKLFANGAQLGGILTHPGKISKEAAERLMSSFNDKYSSVNNAHKTALLEEGMTWAKISMTAEDSQFLESRKYQRSEIAGLYRVPPHMIGDLEKATFSNIEHQDLGFVKHSLTPLLRSIELTLKKDLLTDQEKQRFYFKFSVDGMLRGDVKSRNEAYAISILNGIRNPNECRALEDLNPYDGGDIYRAPLNTAPVGEEQNDNQATA